jgi:hypothetical protein
MSILGGLLDIVGAAVAIYSGGTLGVLAGALMGIGAAAQFGIIGGSVGSFMSSGAGAALIGIVGMGAAAFNLVGAGAQGAEMGQAAASASASTDLAGGAGSTMASTGSAMSGDAGIGMQQIAGMQDPATMAEMAGMNPQDGAALQAESNAANSTADASAAANGASGAGAAPGTASDASNAVNQTANASQVTANQTNTLMNQTGANGADQVSTTPNPNAQVASGAQTQGQGPQYAGASASNPAANAAAPVPGNGAMSPDFNSGPQGNMVEQSAAANPPGQPTLAYGEQQPGVPSSSSATTDTSGGSGGMGSGLLGAAKSIASTPGAIQGIGSVVSGLANGASQQKMIEEQIQAQEWGNLQWQNQSQVGQLQAAAAKPITVPQGYLNRAAATRSMMNGGGAGSPVAGVQPSPVSVGQPISPSPLPAPSVTNPTGGMV